MRNDSLVRCLKLRRLLLGGSLSLESLATTFGVSTRTIRRDVKALQAAGEAVHYLPKPLEPWRWVRSKPLTTNFVKRSQYEFGDA